MADSTKNLDAQDSSYKVAPQDHIEAAEMPSSDMGRVLPRQVSTGSTRGTQTVGYGDTKIDGSNNRIVIGAAPAQTTLGSISDIGGVGSFGLQVTDKDGLKLGLGTLSDGTFGMSISDITPFTYFTLDGKSWTWFDKNNTDDAGMVLAKQQIGLLPDGKYGMKVAKQGYDVRTALDSQLIFNSEQNIFKIVQSDTFTYELTNSGAPDYTVAYGLITITHNHNLGFTPLIVIYVDIPVGSGMGDGINPLPFILTLDGADGSVTSTPVLLSIIPTVNSTTISLRVNAPVAIDWLVPPILTFKYYLLQETAN